MSVLAGSLLLSLGGGWRRVMQGAGIIVLTSEGLARMLTGEEGREGGREGGTVCFCQFPKTAHKLNNQKLFPFLPPSLPSSLLSLQAATTTQPTRTTAGSSRRGRRARKGGRSCCPGPPTRIGALLWRRAWSGSLVRLPFRPSLPPSPLLFIVKFLHVFSLSP